MKELDVLTDAGREAYDMMRVSLSEASSGAVSQNAEVNAFLMALHAESVAKIRQKTHKGYTAADYIKDSLRIERSAQEEDKAYFAAIERGDMAAVRAMVEDKARANGFYDAIPEQTNAYRMRAAEAPKTTQKVYKVFTMTDDGTPSALFVAGKVKLPRGVWLDAVDSWHFTGPNGHEYVPSTKNPWTKGGKTGASIEITDIEIHKELQKRGYISKDDTKNVTALAYRPGWHAGSMPFFPQGGKKKEAAAYGMQHRYNQVVFECEVAADRKIPSSMRTCRSCRKMVCTNTPPIRSPSPT